MQSAFLIETLGRISDLHRAIETSGFTSPEIYKAVYDNLDFTALLSPPLTTFDDRRGFVAESLMEMLLKLIAGENLAPDERIRVIDPVFIKRESA